MTDSPVDAAEAVALALHTKTRMCQGSCPGLDECCYAIRERYDAEVAIAAHIKALTDAGKHVCDRKGCQCQN